MDYSACRKKLTGYKGTCAIAYLICLLKTKWKKWGECLLNRSALLNSKAAKVPKTYIYKPLWKFYRNLRNYDVFIIQIKEIKVVGNRKEICTINNSSTMKYIYVKKIQSNEAHCYGFYFIFVFLKDKDQTRISVLKKVTFDFFSYKTRLIVRPQIDKSMEYSQYTITYTTCLRQKLRNSNHLPRILYSLRNLLTFVASIDFAAS